MGIGYTQARVLLAARKKGVRFDQTATIGRLNAYLSRAELVQLARAYDLGDPHSLPFDETYVDRFFAECLGVRQLTAIDYSDYEGANLVHDMNSPIDAALHNRFDVVIDGGSLEHIFHFPTALRNCMNITKPGGSLFLITPANNYCGHGFYQFSPELMFRVFAPVNGFEIERVLLEDHPYVGADLTTNHAVYEVHDPAVVGERVGLVNNHPVLMTVHARKTHHAEPFAQPPLQSDYQVRWREAGAGISTSVPSPSILRRTARAIYRVMPQWVKNTIIGRALGRQYSFGNRKHYRRIEL